MQNDNNKSRRNYLKALGVIGSASLLGRSASAQEVPDPGTDGHTCGDCGDTTDYPVVIGDTNPVQKTYDGRDYLGVAGIESRYFGTLTNPANPNSGYLHEFYFAGHFTSRDREEGASGWEKKRSILHQQPTITNMKPDECAIISQTTGSGEWVGASRDGDSGSAEFYGGQMKAALEAVIGAVNATAGTYIGIANFVDALANEYDAEPEGSESWGPKFDYKPSLPHDCSNSIHFMISSPTLQDSIHIKKRQEASMPTVNESNQVPYAEAEWTLETRPPANSTNSISVGSGPATSAEAVEAYPSKKVSEEELSQNPAAQEMAEGGEVYRMKLPFNATTSTSSL